MKLLRMIAILGILVLASASPPEDDLLCQKYITTIIEEVSKGQLPNNLSPQTVLFSGKGIQDLGQYLVCRDDSNFRYIHLRVDTGLNPLHLGLCLPSYCHMDFLAQYDELTSQTISKLTNMTITSSEYQDPDQMYPEWSFGTVIVVILLCFVVLLNLVASAVTVFFDKQKEKHQQSILKEQNRNAIYSPSTILQNEVIENQEQLFMSGAKQIGPNHFQKEYRAPTWSKYLQAFSFVHNFRKLFKVEEPQGENQGFVIFNGMRAFSIFWVIYAHDYLMRARTAYNIQDLIYIIQEPGWITLVPAAYFAVDVFFFIGGFLAAVLVLEKLLKMRSVKMALIPSMWLHRFLRIWPTYAFCLLVYWQLSVHWGDGPIWNEYIVMADYCNGTWWRNLLFIDNFFSHKNNGMEYCYGWGWYLSNDFQIFLVTPIILIAYVKNRKIGLGIMWGIFVGSVLWAYILAWVKDYHVMIVGAPHSPPRPDYQDVFYYKPWIRIAPYMMGMLYGLLYRRVQKGDSQFINDMVYKIKTSVGIRTVMYLLGIGMTQTMIWIITPLQKDMRVWSSQSQYLYQAFNRVIFVGGVAICITPALLGIQNDPARKILGHPVWVPIARISFCMYLVHFIVILFMNLSQTQTVYFQNSHMIFFVITDIIYTMFIAGLVSLCVEVPFMNLEKFLFAPKPKRKEVTDTAEQGKE